MSRYNDYSTIAYGRMIDDARRTAPFVEALRQAIAPGSVLLDIGTGTGIFAFLACQFGAARVYAVEADAMAIEVAKRCARDIPGSERITWIEGLTTALDLPEQVDVVVGDLHGTLPFFKGNIESMADAQKRHLKPGGRIIPARDILHVAPAHAPHEYRKVESPWRGNSYGIDLSAATSFVVNQWWRAEASPIQADHLLAAQQRWGVIDYGTSETSSLDNTLEWVVEGDALMHGLYVWFDGDLGEGIGYSNAPTLPELVYGRAFFPLEQPVAVANGDAVRVRLTVRKIKGDHVFRWDSRITSVGGTLKADFRQSTFKARLRSPGNLRKASPDHVPVLSEDGHVAHQILQAMANGQSLQEIASAVAHHHPARYKTPAQALDEVTRLAQRYA